MKEGTENDIVVLCVVAINLFSRNMLSFFFLILALWVLQVSGKALCILPSASVVRVRC